MNGTLTAAIAAGLTATVLTTTAHADGTPTGLTRDEARGAALSADWRGTPGIIAPGRDGSVLFVFGQTQPTIVCAPLRACDIELEPGETVMNVHAGDTVRWQFDGARSGPDGKIPHVLVKPTLGGVETSLAIMTDRRTYHLNLKAHETEYMARVAFSYPQAAQTVATKLAASAPKPAPPKPAATRTAAVAPRADQLNFGYKISGRATWKPERVYSDSRKTYIDMPRQFKNGEAPALFVIGPGRTRQQVNYRLIDGRYIVDALFSKAVLVAGTGIFAATITIERTGS